MSLDEIRVRDIVRVMTRIPIPRGQLVLYKFALMRGDKGFTSAEFSEAIGYDPAEFRGLMAAYAVRINNTQREGEPQKKPGIRLMFISKWTGSQYHYTARPELFAAMDRLPTLGAYLAKPLSDVVAAGSLRVDGVVAPPVVRAVDEDEVPGLASPFHQLLADLDRGGLYFPAETVANVLVALQVKRFVILTGISGTGKTRIAQAIAGRFPRFSQELVPLELGGTGHIYRVAPYVLERSRLAVPAELVAQLGKIQAQGPGTLPVRWPGGRIDLTTYRGTALTLLFRGEFRRWIEANFQVGDPLVLRLEGPADGAPDTVVFEKPARSERRQVRTPNAEIIAVRPDWTDNRGLLGFFNPLTRQYVSTPFLRLVLAAHEEHERATAEKRPAHPFFVLLDEMNLARVEHYFSDLLSALESAADPNDPVGGLLHLHDEPQLEDGETDGLVPRRLRVPPNLFLLGTVNVDESTTMFSPKVLDRAFTVEFNAVDLAGLSRRADDDSLLDLSRWDGALPPPAGATREDWRWFVDFQGGELAGLVVALHDRLAHENRHFGYRVANELARFVRLAVESSDDTPESAAAVAAAALDLALLQKVLVKLAGTRAELSALLDALLAFAITGPGASELGDLSGWALDMRSGQLLPTDEAPERFAVLPRCAAKLWRMRRRLEERGFTSWIE